MAGDHSSDGLVVVGESVTEFSPALISASSLAQQRSILRILIRKPSGLEKWRRWFDDLMMDTRSVLADGRHDSEVASHSMVSGRAAESAVLSSDNQG